ncbi:hypothetical protein [Paraburkholderia fungorum]|uniref:hypothetical protein n=1 Tax=Paraburkholderia fungorum TaxID=134537 RepID=UPI003877DBD9
MSSAGVSAALSCALVWLARTWIGERLRSAIQAEYAAKLETLKVQLKAEADTQLESHKATLKARGDVELEKLRSALAISAAVQSTKYGGLVQRRFDAIAAIHGQLLRFHQAVQQLVQAIEFSGGPSKEDRARAVADAFEAFDAAYLPQRIFLTQSTSERIDQIRQSLVSSANLFNLVISRQQNMAEKWIEIEQRVSKEVALAMAELERDLRALMGDAEAQTS